QTPGQESVKITQSEAGGGEILEGEVLGEKRKIETGERPIPIDTSPEEATRQWTVGQQGARFRGNVIKEKFSDLSSPELIDKYEQGDRTGRLKDVENYFEQRWEQAKEIGILKE